MSESPALCPDCGELLVVREAEAGLHLACDECLWASEPIDLLPPGGDDADYEAVLDEVWAHKDESPRSEDRGDPLPTGGG